MGEAILGIGFFLGCSFLFIRVLNAHLNYIGSIAEAQMKSTSIYGKCTDIKDSIQIREDLDAKERELKKLKDTILESEQALADEDTIKYLELTNKIRRMCEVKSGELKRN